jgi:hypothetical protein
VKSVWHDLRYGLRILRKNLGISVISILTLALGIGATTVIFSVVDIVLLNPFPYKDADRLATPSISVGITRFPVPVFLNLKEQNHTFEDLAALAYFNNPPYAKWGADSTIAWVLGDREYF